MAVAPPGNAAKCDEIGEAGRESETHVDPGVLQACVAGADSSSSPSPASSPRAVPWIEFSLV